MTSYRPRHHRPPHPDRDGGFVTIEVLLCSIVIIGVVALLMVGGRLALARSSVDQAAADAARAASLARVSEDALTAANQVANQVLQADGVDCDNPEVDVDTSAFYNTPAGELGQIQVTITCTVPFVPMPGIPASHTITSTATSVLDTYVERS